MKKLHEVHAEVTKAFGADYTVLWFRHTMFLFFGPALDDEQPMVILAGGTVHYAAGAQQRMTEGQLQVLRRAAGALGEMSRSYPTPLPPAKALFQQRRRGSKGDRETIGRAVWP